MSRKPCPVGLEKLTQLFYQSVCPNHTGEKHSLQSSSQGEKSITDCSFSYSLRMLTNDPKSQDPQERTQEGGKCVQPGSGLAGSAMC